MDDNHCYDERIDAPWVVALLEKHDLYLRADTLNGIVYVMVSDVALELQSIADSIIEERFVKLAPLANIERLVAMLQDTRALALCDLK